jgi:two-component system alkaline phosphatase synthesis response regulator PhoP
MNRKILLVEDEEDLSLTLADRLENEGYAVEAAMDGETAVEMGVNGSYDLIILDVMLPRKNGFDVCRDLRQKNITIPILMLTAKGETIDKVIGLKLGADDYLTKPFEITEMLARVEALLRRSPLSITPQNLPDQYSFDSITVDLRRTEVCREKQLVEMTAKEFKLLQYFITHRGLTISRDELLDAVWGYNTIPSSRTVDVHINWLRQKIEPNPENPRYILTVHGFGYKFIG